MASLSIDFSDGVYAPDQFALFRHLRLHAANHRRLPGNRHGARPARRTRSADDLTVTVVVGYRQGDVALCRIGAQCGRHRAHIGGRLAVPDRYAHPSMAAAGHATTVPAWGDGSTATGSVRAARDPEGGAPPAVLRLWPDLASAWGTRCARRSPVRHSLSFASFVPGWRPGAPLRATTPRAERTEPEPLSLPG